MSQDSRDIDRRSVLQGLAAGTVGAVGTMAGSGVAGADDSSTHYHNPVGPIGFGDVTVIQAGDGSYYAYGTETPEDIVPVARSEDLVNWSYITSALDSYPDWRDDPDAGVWAPDINYYNGQYHLYYSYSTWGSQNNPGIGLATSDTPEGPFTDQGPVFREADLDYTNCIDSEFVVVDGTPYMVWGSYYGFYGVELTADGADFVPGTEFQLAGDVGEGSMIVQENGYYYLFYSTGKCCDGYDSTYEVEVGRADSFFGPYYNQNGDDLRDLNEFFSGVPILAGTDRFTSPGHNTTIRDDNGDLWMLYHVEATTDNEVRQMMLDRIHFDSNDWPVVACDGRPSERSEVPNSGSYSCGAPTPGDYRLRSANSEKLLEVAGAGTANGDNVQQYGNTDNDCQEWTVTDNGDGTFTLTNVNSGKLLEVAAAGTSNGDNVRQYTDTGHPCQDWAMPYTGPGEYSLVNDNSGKAADVEGKSTADGANVLQYDNTGAANQRWRLEPIGPNR